MGVPYQSQMLYKRAIKKEDLVFASRCNIQVSVQLNSWGVRSLGCYITVIVLPLSPTHLAMLFVT